MKLDFVEVANILSRNQIAFATHVRLNIHHGEVTLPSAMLGEPLIATVTYTDGSHHKVIIPPHFRPALRFPIQEDSDLTIRSIHVQRNPALTHQMQFLVRTDRRNGKIKLVATSLANTATSEIHVNIFIGLRDYQLRHMASELNLQADLWEPYFALVHKLYRIYYDRAAEAVHIHRMGLNADGVYQVIDASITVHDEATRAQPQGPFVVDLNQQTTEDTPPVLCVVNGTVMGLAALDEIQLQDPKQPVKLVNIGYLSTPADLATTLGVNYGGLSIKTQLLILFASDYTVTEYLNSLSDIDYAKYRDNTILYLQGRTESSPDGITPHNLLSNVVTIAHTLEEAVALSLQANKYG